VVILHQHDPEWAAWFTQLRQVICAKLGIPAGSIHHVGSTAVPGLIAKPIIDMDIEIPDYEEFPAVSAGLQELGYEDKGDLEIKDRIAFGRRDPMVPYCTPKRGWIDHHLYVCPSFSLELKRHLAFRDALFRNPKARAEYAALKRSLEREARGERSAYVALKEERARKFIEGLSHGL
jgi:GrpB-like predicted nucleotidyltransferase (UPF0157 family)